MLLAGVGKVHRVSERLPRHSCFSPLFRFLHDPPYIAPEEGVVLLMLKVLVGLLIEELSVVLGVMAEALPREGATCASGKPGRCSQHYNQ